MTGLVDIETGKLEWLVNGYQNWENMSSQWNEVVKSAEHTIDMMKGLTDFNIGEMKFPETKIGETVVKAEGILPPGMPGRSDKVKAPDFDVSRARQLIAESGYRDVRNFPEIVLSLAGNRTSAPPEINAIVAMLRHTSG